MVENTDPATKSGGKSNSKIMGWIKKNKTLAAVLGIGGGYFLWHEMKKNEIEEVEGTPEGVSGSLTGPAVAEGEDTHEAIDQEINRVGEEVKEEREERERNEERKELENGGQEGGEQETAPGSGETEPNNSGNESTPSTESGGGQQGITIHGKFFAGATGSHIAKTGTTEGDKKYIEYTITFPGRQEHWQYFTATGNWRQSNNSATGPASGKPGGPNPGSGGGGGGGNTGGNPPPSNDPNHPNAVRTDNKCVNGGVGSHQAPVGYHLYCGPDNYIWRAPDPTGVSPGKPVKSPGGGGGGGGAPAPAPAPAPSCPAGTVANIQQNRNEVNRLTNEIQSLKANKPKGWVANVANKEANRNAAQGAVDRGRAQPGCGNV